MDDSFTPRPASEDDLPQIAKMENEIGGAGWVEENFRAELGKPYSQFLILTDDETDSKIAGYIIFWILFDECQILNLAIDLPYRGLGLAKKLLQRAISASTRKGIRKLLLEVRKSNLAAIQLYQGIGFAIIHVRKGFYSDGEDAYQMALSFDPQRLL